VIANWTAAALTVMLALVLLLPWMAGTAAMLVRAAFRHPRGLLRRSAMLLLLVGYGLSYLGSGIEAEVVGGIITSMVGVAWLSCANRKEFGALLEGLAVTVGMFCALGAIVGHAVAGAHIGLMSALLIALTSREEHARIVPHRGKACANPLRLESSASRPGSACKDSDTWMPGIRLTATQGCPERM
jgi:hypothetical protein